MRRRPLTRQLLELDASNAERVPGAGRGCISGWKSWKRPSSCWRPAVATDDENQNLYNETMPKAPPSLCGGSYSQRQGGYRRREKDTQVSTMPDGTEPTQDSQVYQGTHYPEKRTTLKAIAVAEAIRRDGIGRLPDDVERTEIVLRTPDDRSAVQEGAGGRLWLPCTMRTWSSTELKILWAIVFTARECPRCLQRQLFRLRNSGWGHNSSSLGTA